MLRCKLGCSRPNGNKVFNSHYHCCVCGHICIRKSGLYEHMRVQHGGLTGKNVVPKTEHCCSGDKDVQHKQNCNQTQLEDGSKASPAVQATALLTPTQHESLKPEEADNQSGRSATQAFAGQFQPEGAGNQQAVTVQIPSLGEGQSGTGQQLVIVMPQQTPQGQSVNSVQAQQPIVIVMPQMAPGQVTQPVVVPVANAGS